MVPGKHTEGESVGVLGSLLYYCFSFVSIPTLSYLYHDSMYITSWFKKYTTLCIANYYTVPSSLQGSIGPVV